MANFKPVYCFECYFGLQTNIAMKLGLVNEQQWVGLMNETMNVNSWIVLKSKYCYQRNG